MGIFFWRLIFSDDYVRLCPERFGWQYGQGALYPGGFVVSANLRPATGCYSSKRTGTTRNNMAEIKHIN